MTTQPTPPSPPSWLCYGPTVGGFWVHGAEHAVRDVEPAHVVCALWVHERFELNAEAKSPGQCEACHKKNT